MEKESEKIYELPKEFYDLVKPYLEGTAKITKKNELINLWQLALSEASRHPNMREAIAEWTVSIGTHSPFILDNDILEAIHQGFGSLEVADSHTEATREKADLAWQKQQELFNTIADKGK